MEHISQYIPFIAILLIFALIIAVMIKVAKPPDIMFDTYEDVSKLEIGAVYTLKQKRARYWWTLLFGITTGDLNPMHINYFGAKRYKSHLGGLARHGVSMLADCEAQVFKIFGITAPTEIIALGYDNIRYFAPCNIGTRFTYTYTLEESILKNNKVRVKWLLQAKDSKGVLLMEGHWKIMYAPVEVNENYGRLLNRIGNIFLVAVGIYVLLATAAWIFAMIYNLIAPHAGWPLIHFFDNLGDSEIGVSCGGRCSRVRQLGFRLIFLFLQIQSIRLVQKIT